MAMGAFAQDPYYTTSRSNGGLSGVFHDWSRDDIPTPFASRTREVSGFDLSDPSNPYNWKYEVSIHPSDTVGDKGDITFLYLTAPREKLLMPEPLPSIGVCLTVWVSGLVAEAHLPTAEQYNPDSADWPLSEECGAALRSDMLNLVANDVVCEVPAVPDSCIDYFATSGISTVSLFVDAESETQGLLANKPFFWYRHPAPSDTTSIEEKEKLLTRAANNIWLVGMVARFEENDGANLTKATFYTINAKDIPGEETPTPDPTATPTPESVGGRLAVLGGGGLASWATLVGLRGLLVALGSAAVVLY